MPDYYNHAGYPAQGAAGSSSAMRAELDAIAAAFNKLPILSGNPLKIIRVNSSGTALEAVTAGSADISAGDVSVTPAGSISSLNVQAALVELDTDISSKQEAATAVSKTASTGSAVMPAGTTAQRDASPSAGYMRFNTTLGTDEVWNGTSWAASGDSYINVMNMGAIADGVTSDSAVFQAALDLAKATGKRVVAPAGQYFFATGLTYQTTSADTFTPGLVLIGDGVGKTILINGSNSTLLNLSTNTALKFQLGGMISGMSITTSGTATSAVAISLKSAYEYSLADFRIVGGLTGIQLVSSLGDSDSCNNITIDRARIENCTAWGVEFSNGVGVNETSFVSMRNVIIQGCGTLDGVGGGMYWRGQALYMEQTAFVLCNNRGLYIEGGAGLGNTLTGINTVFENNIGKCIECWGIQGMKLYNSQLYANDASYTGTNKGHLVYFNGGSSVIRNVEINGVVVRATAANNPVTAFHVQGGNADVNSMSISNVTWDSFGTTGQTKYSGISPKTDICVMAYRSAAFNLTTSNVILPFDAALLNRGSRYDAGTGKFTPEITGAYKFSGQLQYTPSGAGEGVIVSLYNVTGAATVQQQFLRSAAGGVVSDFLFEFSQVLTAGTDYAIYVLQTNGTRALSVGSSVSRLLIQSI